MPDYKVFSHWALGNTAIQLAAAISITETLKSLKLDFTISPAPEICIHNGVGMDEEFWNEIEPLLGEELACHSHPRLKRCIEGPIVQTGYYQDPKYLIPERSKVLERFRTEFGEFPLSKGGATVAQALAAPPPFEILDTDIAIHVRLGDYRGAGLVIDPAPQIAILRQLRLENPTARIFLVTQAPTTDAERNYLKFFEEVRPILQCGTELEDFAVLRSVRRLIVTNSTFSWVAGWMAAAGQQERWIPAPSFNKLGRIEAGDHIYSAENGYDLSGLEIPTGSLLPVTGEFLQSLCDYTVLTRHYKIEMHKWVDIACPPERQLFTEEEWSDTIYNTTKSLFLYPNIHTIEAVLKYSWPALRLLIIHSSDFTVPQTHINQFLEAHPTVYIWVQNAIDTHPRQRILPIFLENRVWRNDRRDIKGVEQEVDTPMILERPDSEGRPYKILCTQYWPTHPIRRVWDEYIKTHCRGDTRIMVLPRLDVVTYSEMIPLGHTVLCPPGNGIDTHRTWEVLQCGGYPILLDSAHTCLLQQQYPSLPLLRISKIEEIHTLEIPSKSPSEFHPLFLREYWKVLFRSHI